MLEEATELHPVVGRIVLLTDTIYKSFGKQVQSIFWTKQLNGKQGHKICAHQLHGNYIDVGSSFVVVASILFFMVFYLVLRFSSTMSKSEVKEPYKSHEKT